MVREAGLEPARPEWTLEPESSESANSTTRAYLPDNGRNDFITLMGHCQGFLLPVGQFGVHIAYALYHPIGRIAHGVRVYAVLRENGLYSGNGKVFRPYDVI